MPASDPDQVLSLLGVGPDDSGAITVDFAGRGHAFMVIGPAGSAGTFPNGSLASEASIGQIDNALQTVLAQRAQLGVRFRGCPPA